LYDSNICLYIRKRVIPPYLNRGNFIPFKEEDFGDGGAFPEIHVAQYPLDMGKPGSKSTAVISVDVDESGEIRYDAIVRQGVNKDKIVRTSLADMKEKDGDANKLALPQEDEEQEIADKTKMALEALLDGKIKKAKPTTIHSANEGEEPTYIRYTPNPNAPG
jgi:SNW domain-containing protein 1